MTDLPAKYDLYQEYEYAGYEPYMYDQQQLQNLYYQFARLALIKAQLEEKKDFAQVSCLESSILAYLTSLPDQTLVVNSFINFLPEISKGRNIDQIAADFRIIASKTNNWEFISQYISQLKVVPLYLSDFSLEDLIRFFILNRQQGLQLAVLEILNYSNLENLIHLIELSEQNNLEIKILLVNKLDSELEAEYLNNLLLRNIKKYRYKIFNNINCLEVLNDLDSDLVIFNHMHLPEYYQEIDAFQFFEQSLLSRGLIAKSEVKKLFLENVEINPIELNLSEVVEINHLDQALVQIQGGAFFFRKLKEYVLNFSLDADFIVELYKANLLSKVRLKINEEYLTAQVLTFLKELLRNHNYEIFYKLLRDLETIDSSSPSFIIDSSKVENLETPYQRVGDNLLINGEDLTLVTWGDVAFNTIRELNQLDYSIEVIILQQLWPLDIDLIIESVEKTGKLLIVPDTKYQDVFVSSYLNLILEEIYLLLDAPPKIVDSNLSNCVKEALDF